MSLELGNHWKGQFFTPYDVCRCMAELTIHDNMQKLQNKEWVSVNDPACGAGATLIAAANTFRRKGFNYQTQVLFVANDIDRVTAQMCFIQLSLLGCPGYVAVANTLSDVYKRQVNDLAEELGCSRCYLSSTLNGKNTSIEIRRRISDYLNISDSDN